jgi:hypothetical protein
MPTSKLLALSLARLVLDVNNRLAISRYESYFCILTSTITIMMPYFAGISAVDLKIFAIATSKLNKLLRLGKPLSFVPSRGYIDNKQHKHM